MRRDLRAAGSGLEQAGTDVAGAARAGVRAASHAAVAVQHRVRKGVSRARGRVEKGLSAVGERLSGVRERVSDATEDAQRSVEDVGSQLSDLPDFVREGARRLEDAIPQPVVEGARRRIQAIENVAARLVSALLARSSIVLTTLADYLGGLAARRPADRAALEGLLEEQAACARKAAEVFDRAVAKVDEPEARRRLVHFRLQAIKQTELLDELLATVRRSGGDGLAQARGSRSDAAVRRTLTEALLIAERCAENWQALSRLATAIEDGPVAEDLWRTCGSVGSDADEPVEFLRDTLRSEIVQGVLA